MLWMKLSTWDDQINLIFDNEFRENQTGKIYITVTGVNKVTFMRVS
jgi:hypothetical protein